MEEMKDFNISENIWKIDGPIGRLDFFVKSVIYTICTGLGFLLFSQIAPFVPLFIIVILIIAIFWLFFVITAKRLWDIFGEKKTGLISAILTYTIGLLITPIGGIVCLICLFVKGKYIE